jgi:large repetitive protein
MATKITIDNTDPTKVTFAGINFDKDNTPSFTGKLTGSANNAGQLIQIRDSLSVIGTVKTASDGSWSFDFGSASGKTLSDGAHNINVRLAGNAAVTATYKVTIDTSTATPTAFASPASTYTDVNGATHIVTNTSYPMISGRAEPGAEVDFFNRDVVVDNPDLPPDQRFGLIGSTTADASGNYSFELKVFQTDDEGNLILDAKGNPMVDANQSTNLFPDGTYRIGVTSTDPATNYAVGAPIVIEVDTVVQAPVVYSLDNAAGISDGAANINGVVYTNDDTPTIKGLAETGSEVTITDAAGNVLGTAMADGAVVNGQSTFTFQVDNAQALSQGLHTFNFITTDRAGNVSTPTPQVIGVDSQTTAPTVSMADAVTSGRVKYTNDNTPTISGVAEAGATVEFKDQLGNTLGSVTAGSNGAYSFTPTTAMADGAKTITAKSTDALGNSASTTYNVTIDTQIAAPTMAAGSPALTVGGVTYNNDSTPTITGTAEAGSTVTVTDGTTVLGTTVAGSDGKYSFTTPDEHTMSEGSHALSVSAKDIAGNVSETVTQNVTIDTRAPTVTETLASPAVTSAGVTYDRDNTPTITGVTEAGSTVTVKDGDTVLGTTVAGADGKYSFTPAESFKLIDGVHTLNVTATDLAGNVSAAAASQTVKIDTVAPTVTETLTSPAVVAANGVTYDSDNTPTIKGVAEAGATVTVSDGDTVLGSTVADDQGNYSFTPTAALADGVHTLNVTATDLAGNVSAAAASQTFTIDATAPNKPTESVAVSPTLTVGGVTYDTDRTPTITGTAEAGSTVTIMDGTTTLGTTTANAQGAYSFTVADANQLSGGAHSFSVTATDLAGNTSTASPATTRNVVCYMSGTRLQTQDGWKLVEQLTVGDLLKTASGQSQPVTWLGSTTIDCRRQGNKQHAYPVRIAQHAFGYQLPERDLFVSPLHSIYVEGVMIPAIHLVNGLTVTQDQTEGLVTYYHVELPQHDAVFAEGLPAETYLDTSPENRHFFSMNNGDQKVFEMNLQFPACPEGTPVWQHIWDTQGYAPLTQSGPIVEAVKAMLMQQAQLVQEDKRLFA